MTKPGWRGRIHPGAVGLRGHCRGCRDDLNRIGVHLQELADDDVGVEADGVRVGANEGAAKDPRRPLGHVVPFQGVQQRQLDLGLLRDRDEGNGLFFTPLAQPGA